MRFAVALVLWLTTTVGLAVAVPAAWVQMTIVNEDGYTALAREAASDPTLQSAMAAELTTRAMALIAAKGKGRHPADSSQIHDAAAAFTAGPSFPPLFAQANRAVHGWLFTEAQDSDQWVVDLAPMLNDSSLQPILSSYNVKAPAKLTIPVASSLPPSLRQGQWSWVSTWGPWLSIGAAGLTGLCALLTLAAARRRGKGLTCLGVSALLVGAAGWAGIEIAARRVNEALNRTTGNIRQIADVLVSHAEAGMHQWLDLTLITGIALVGFGVIVAILGGLLKKAGQEGVKPVSNPSA